MRDNTYSIGMMAGMGEPQFKVENIYTLVMWYEAAKKQLEWLRKSDNRALIEAYKEIVASYEARFRQLNEDIDVMAYFGEQNAA
jgi:hypothetical protein